MDDNDNDRPPRRRRAPASGRTVPPERSNGQPDRGSARSAARRALREVAELTGHDVEGVVSVEPADDGWKIGVEVVEAHRIPDSADILAVYQVQLGPDGELSGYRRLERYARGQTYGGQR